MTTLLSTRTLSNQFHHSRQFFYVLTDLKGICLYGNPFFFQQSGIRYLDGEGMRFSDLLQKTESDKLDKAITGCLENPATPTSLDLQHQVPDSDLVHMVRWELQPLKNEQDKIDLIQFTGVLLHRDKPLENSLQGVTAEERYKAFEMSAEAIWRLELEIPASVDQTMEELVAHCRKYGYMAECNDNLARMYGLRDHTEMVGMRLDSMMNLEDPKQEAMLRNFIRDGFTVKNGETEEYDKNGNRLYFLNTMKGVVENGLLKRIWGTQQDITEKKKAEEERLRSELFYRNLIGDSLDGILLTDVNGMITFASPSVEKILGYRPEELIQTHAFTYVHEEDQAEAKSAFENEVNMDPVIKFIDVRLKTKYGEWLYCNVRGHNMLYNPYVGRMAIYFHDESRRKEIEDRLRESEQRFRQLIDNLNTGVMLQDENSNVLICNKSARELLGLTEDQLMGNKPFDPKWHLICEDGSDFTKQDQPVSKAIRTKQAVRNVIVGVCKQQEDKKWLLLNADPIINEAGDIVHVICSFTDITEQKRLAQKLVEQEVQKHKLLTKATIDAQEKERREIGKELHDNISQHLTTTRLYLEVASERSTGEVQDMIRHAHKELSDIIVEIRNISQSLVPPTLGDIGLVDSVKDICVALRRVHPITVKFDHQSFSEEAVSDNRKLMLFRIIQEQVNNVVRHSGAERVNLELRTNSNQVILTISDNGNGFDTTVAKKGLGLANMSNRADLFNGKMELRSEPGEGCTVIVTLPLK